MKQLEDNLQAFIAKQQAEHEAKAKERMGLRDYFAARAMQAFLTGQKATGAAWYVEADAAYEVADAMLEARKL